MGADFTCSICPLPDINEQTKKHINKNINDIDERDINAILNNYHHDWKDDVRSKIENIDEGHLFMIDDLETFFKRELVVELVKEALSEVLYSNRRDVGHVMIEGKWWIISGGMSWGDSPTEAMYYIDILDESGVLDELNKKN